MKSNQPQPPAVEMATWGWSQSLEAVLDCVCNILLGFEVLFPMFYSGKLEVKLLARKQDRFVAVLLYLGTTGA